MKGTFNQGWWNCFEHFAADLLDLNPNMSDLCIDVLRGAGITEKEASYWLDHSDCPCQSVVDVVREYWRTEYGT